MIIGDKVSINDGTVLSALSEISIGECTTIAENVMIRDHDHDYLDVKIGEQPVGYIVHKVTIGKGCWLGFASIILKEVNLGDGVIVGAGSVVTQNFTTGFVVVGNPAKAIYNRRDK